MKPVILCFIPYYLPGFRSGGPVRSIANLVDHLGDEFHFRIVTCDRDVLDLDPYVGVPVDCWTRVGKASVFYGSRNVFTLFGVAKFLRNTPYDVLYLNSFFAYKSTVLPLWALKLGLAPRKPCVIAPRGEFSNGALALKSTKKRLYLTVAKALNLCSSLCWQASSEFEQVDIRRLLRVDAKSVFIAPDLPPVGVKGKCSGDFGRQHEDRALLRLVFLSRISPMKNLDFLLQVLSCSAARIQLDIFGPLDNPKYWARCQVLIQSLPAHISVNYKGEVDPSRVLDVFSACDLFVLPTRGENYGHVVLESLTAGTPVLISDQTPWFPSSDGAVQVLPLGDPFVWASALDRWGKLSSDERLRIRSAAHHYADRYVKSTDVVDKNRKLFFFALSVL